jgi:hypothetical protein
VRKEDARHDNGMNVITRVNAWQKPKRLLEYRYRLGFQVNPKGKGRILFIGLNPSTASLYTTDPTVDSFCRGIAYYQGFHEMEIINLFALRSTDRKGLLQVTDPVGRWNNHSTREALQEADLVVTAWGAYFHPIIRERAQQVLQLLTTSSKCAIHCIGRNKDGSPTHPLYQNIKCRLISI